MWPQRLSRKLVFGSELSHSHLGFYEAQKEVIPLLHHTADPGSALRCHSSLAQTLPPEEAPVDRPFWGVDDPSMPLPFDLADIINRVESLLWRHKRTPYLCYTEAVLPSIFNPESWHALLAVRIKLAHSVVPSPVCKQEEARALKTRHRGTHPRSFTLQQP
ncbi:Alpha-ketoglutarate-dependent dioxygenase FTO [Collichthys lucidus]|uniref:Alpha-ketoglutarate-dependent dioxygenase FTO n=1 Tax=Collichthys lucidus TaxID=240159 RepID=A0A4U5U9P5_COLLU|nr:Alpha-ketoglutarate-dependent dioxygenase FTO [Collichthys lucidus]